MPFHPSSIDPSSVVIADPSTQLPRKLVTASSRIHLRIDEALQAPWNAPFIPAP
jgi:hypothetical protein